MKKLFGLLVIMLCTLTINAQESDTFALKIIKSSILEMHPDSSNYTLVQKWGDDSGIIEYIGQDVTLFRNGVSVEFTPIGSVETKPEEELAEGITYQAFRKMYSKACGKCEIHLTNYKTGDHLIEFYMTDDDNVVIVLQILYESL